MRNFDFESATNDLIADKITVVHREGLNGGGRLELIDANTTDACHFHHYSNRSYGAISTCDGNLASISIHKFE